MENAESLIETLASDLEDINSYISDLMAAMPNPVYTVNAAGVIIDSNKALMELTGYSLEELLGSKAYTLFADKAEAKSVEKETVEKGYVKGKELTLSTRDGKEIPVAIFTRARTDDSGNVFYVATLVDIARRKQAEKLLQESERKYRELVENMSEGLCSIDEKEVVTFVNSRLCQMLGYKLEEMVGKHVYSFFDADNLKILKRELAQRRKGISSQYEIAWTVKSGRQVPTFMSAIPIFDAQGIHRGSYVTVLDFTERKQHEELQRKIFQNTQVGIFIVQDGKFKYVNPQFEHYSGYTSEELLERPALNLVYPEDRERVRENAIKMLKGERAQAYEYRSVRKDGQIIWIMEKVAPIEYQGKRATLGSYMDITEHKQEEQRKTQFISMLAHELNTPLTPILSSGKLLAEQLKPKGEVESRLARNILNGAHTLSERLNEFLEMAKGEAGLIKINPEPLEAEKLIERVAEQYLPLFAARKQKFQVEMEGPLPYVLADEQRTIQVISNLLSNANKFTPEGGQVNLRAKAEGSALVIEVEDNGPGISPEQQATLFRPYSHSDKFPGLGLGLAICKQLVELQGGKIWYHSQQGKGSTFGFSLPLAKEKVVRRQ